MEVWWTLKTCRDRFRFHRFSVTLKQHLVIFWPVENRERVRQKYVLEDDEPETRSPPFWLLVWIKNEGILRKRINHNKLRVLLFT